MTSQPFVVFDYQTPQASPLTPVKNEVRCHETGRTDVTAVCHHSGRFLSHVSEAKPKFYQDRSLEFDPMLKGKEAHGAHSKEHAHFLPYSPLKVLIIPGAALALLGVGQMLAVLPRLVSLDVAGRAARALGLLSFEEALTLISPLLAAALGTLFWPLLFFVVGLVLLGIGFNQYRIYHRIAMSQPLEAIPLLSDYYNVVVEEKIKIPMQQNANKELFIDLMQAEGEGEVTLEILLDGQEIEKARRLYREKGATYGFPPLDAFNLGWLYVEPSPYTVFSSGQHLLPMRKRIPPLETPDIITWFDVAKYTYRVDTAILQSQLKMPNAVKRTILWIRPLVKAYSGGYTLQLEFDILPLPSLSERGSYDSKTMRAHRLFLEKLRYATFECIELKVKPRPFSKSDDPPIVSSRGRVSVNRNEVRWQNIPLRDVLPDARDPSRPQHQREPLSVTFAEPITRFRPNGHNNNDDNKKEVKNEIEIIFKLVVEDASISGIAVDRDRFWLPNGRSATETKRNFSATYRTVLDGTLTVQPEVLAFTREVTHSEPLERAPGIPLTSAAIIKLVQELEENNDTHIKSVVKSTPVTEAENNLAYQKRSWNISGRRYYGNNKHPLDFYILLVSRTPLLEGDTTTWGNVTYRSLQMNRIKPNSKNDGDSINESLEEKLKEECLATYDQLREMLQPEEIPPDSQFVVPRILGRS